MLGGGNIVHGRVHKLDINDECTLTMAPSFNGRFILQQAMRHKSRTMVVKLLSSISSVQMGMKTPTSSSWGLVKRPYPEL
jgi:hypothetical protein